MAHGCLGGHVVLSLLTEDPWFQKGALRLSCPLQVYVLTSGSPGPQDVTAFGESIFKELIKLQGGQWGRPRCQGWGHEEIRH